MEIGQPPATPQPPRIELHSLPKWFLLFCFVLYILAELGVSSFCLASAWIANASPLASEIVLSSNLLPCNHSSREFRSYLVELRRSTIFHHRTESVQNISVFLGHVFAAWLHWSPNRLDAHKASALSVPPPTPCLLGRIRYL